VIIGANSLINKDIPDNSVVAGVPAKVIKTFDEYLEKRALDEAVKGIGGEAVSKEAEEFLWEKFWKDKGALEIVKYQMHFVSVLERKRQK